MRRKIRTVSTELWCKEKENIFIDEEIMKEHIRGIYGFFVETPYGEECVYVGKAINIRDRIYEHLTMMKWQTMNCLKEEPGKYIKILVDALQDNYNINVKLLKKVDYEYVDYNRDLHHLAFLEYCYIEKYQKKQQCLTQRPEGSFNDTEHKKWQSEFKKRNKSV